MWDGRATTLWELEHKRGVRPRTAGRRKLCACPHSIDSKRVNLDLGSREILRTPRENSPHKKVVRPPIYPCASYYYYSTTAHAIEIQLSRWSCVRRWVCRSYGCMPRRAPANRNPVSAYDRSRRSVRTIAIVVSLGCPRTRILHAARAIQLCAHQVACALLSCALCCAAASASALASSDGPSFCCSRFVSMPRRNLASSSATCTYTTRTMREHTE